MSATPATIVSTEAFELPYLKEKGQRVRYSNGHTLLFVPRKGSVFNVSTWVQTGSMNEDAANNGVSHFLEHLMFKGTERFGPGVFDRAMESMGAIINAATWKDYTFYYITGPNTAYGEFAKALDMHADMLLHSTLPEGEIGVAYDPDKGENPEGKRERGVVIEEIGMGEDNPWRRIYRMVNEAMYSEAHPYRREVIGTRHIVGTIPREQILAYYRRWYAPQAMTTMVVGDFELDALTTQVAEAFNFAAIAGKDAAIACYNEPPAADSFIGAAAPAPCSVSETGEYDTRFLMLGWHAAPLQNLKDTLALRVASHVLGESRSSRLYQNLVEKQTPSKFTLLSSMQYECKLGNVFFVRGNFLAEDAEVAKAEILAELAALQGEEGLDETSFKRAIKKLKSEFAHSVETSSGIADALGESVTLTGDITFFTELLPALDALTLADVQAALATYLRPDAAFTALLTPAQV